MARITGVDILKHVQFSHDEYEKQLKDDTLTHDERIGFEACITELKAMLQWMRLIARVEYLVPSTNSLDHTKTDITIVHKEPMNDQQIWLRDKIGIVSFNTVYSMLTQHGKMIDIIKFIRTRINENLSENEEPWGLKVSKDLCDRLFIDFRGDIKGHFEILQEAKEARNNNNNNSVYNGKIP